MKPTVSDTSVLTLKFLVTSNSDQPSALYLNTALQEKNSKNAPTWLANSWTLDHPYGAEIYFRTWRPWIFLSNGTPSREIIHAYVPKPDTPGTLWGLRSFMVTTPELEP